MSASYQSINSRNPFSDDAEAFNSYPLVDRTSASPQPTSRFSIQKSKSPLLRKKWVLGGSALFVAIVLASVLGGVLGSRSSSSNSSQSAEKASSGSGNRAVEDDSLNAQEDLPMAGGNGTAIGSAYGYDGDVVTME